MQESVVRPSNLIAPVFVHDEDKPVNIDSMPGIQVHSLKSLADEISESVDYGIQTFLLFPRINDKLKSNYAEESYNPDGLIQRAIREVKEQFPDVVVATDVALDPYSDQGHDGVVEDGIILNDETLMQICKQAVSHARAGADMVSPSEMMDGRVEAIRTSLDSDGFTDVSIMSYTAKYCSSLYTPFRDALKSHMSFGDKKTYQMDISNVKEAEYEAHLDMQEGADMLLIKPGLPYLDIVSRIKKISNIPVGGYHVSGEYSMIKAAAEKKYIDEKKTVLEMLKCFKRAGCDAIVTYYAKQAAKWMTDQESEPSY